MRKVLIATIVAMVLFAVGAFAASFTMEPSELASGSGDVVSCTGDTKPVVKFQVGPRDATDWPIIGANVTGVPSACNGEEIEIVLTNGARDADVVSATGTAAFTFVAPAGASPVYAGPAEVAAYAMRIGGTLVTTGS